MHVFIIVRDDSKIASVCTDLETAKQLLWRHSIKALCYSDTRHAFYSGFVRDSDFYVEEWDPDLHSKVGMWHFGNWGHVLGISAMKYKYPESWQLFLESLILQIEPLDTLACIDYNHRQMYSNPS
jgi:hypothetical protein